MNSIGFLPFKDYEYKYDYTYFLLGVYLEPSRTSGDYLGPKTMGSHKLCPDWTLGRKLITLKLLMKKSNK